jgi:hypothetical protein
VKHAQLQSSNRANLIELSTRYNVLSKWTSFVAVEERSTNQNISENIQIEKLLDMESVDELNGIAYEPVTASIFLAPLSRNC